MDSTTREPTDVVESKGGGAKEEEEGDEMEKMLNELTSIVPPSSMPPDWSLSSGKSDGNGAESEEAGSEDKGAGSEDTGTESEENESLDMLALMRKRLEESLLDDTPDERGVGPGAPLGQGEVGSDAPQGLGEAVEGSDEPSMEGAEDEREELDAAINILPPTPTITKDMLGSSGNTHNLLHSQHLMDSLAVQGNANGSTTLEATTTTTTTTIATASLPVPNDAEVEGGLEKEETTDQGLLFSPASSRNSPDLKKVCCVIRVKLEVIQPFC